MECNFGADVVRAIPTFTLLASKKWPCSVIECRLLRMLQMVDLMKSFNCCKGHGKSSSWQLPYGQKGVVVRFIARRIMAVIDYVL